MKQTEYGSRVRPDGTPAETITTPDGVTADLMFTRTPETAAATADLLNEDREPDRAATFPLEPDNHATRLVRAIFGQCPDCDHDAESHHDGDDYGATHHCTGCGHP